MLWNQTETRAIGFGDLQEDEQPDKTSASNSQTVAADIHRMRIEKVETLVARFLSIEPGRMADHFRPASGEQLSQIIAIRQHFVRQTAEDDEQYLRWRYRFDVTSEGSELLNDNRVWVFCKEGEILGFVGVEACKLLVDNKPVKAVKLMDLVVKPEVDRKGLGVWMNLRLQSMGCPIVTLGSNRNSIGIMSKLFQRLPNQRVYKNVLNGRAYIQARLAGVRDGAPSKTRFSRRLVAYAAAAVYDAGYPLLLKAQAFTPRKGTSVRIIERFSSEHNASLRAMNGDRIRLLRSSESLNWRFFDNPRDQVQVNGIWEHDQLIGYVAIALRQKIHSGVLYKSAFLLDWGILPGRLRQRVLVRVMRDCQRGLRQKNYESITAFGYGSAHDQLLRRAGLYLRDDDSKTVSIYSDDKALLHKLLDGDGWSLTGADTDYA